jgi:hypothetical protein
MQPLLRSAAAFAGMVLGLCGPAGALIGCNALTGVNDFVIDYEASADGTLAEGASGGDSASPNDGGRIDATIDAGLDAPRDATDASTLDTSVVDAAAPGLTLSTSGIDFGLVNCGAGAPASKTLTIYNMGGAPLTWAASLSATQAFSLVGVVGASVAPGGSATVTIAASAVPAVTGAGTTLKATLTLTSNDPANATVLVPISLSAAGGTLTVTPLAAAFGQSMIGAAATPIPVAVTNVGNQAVTVGFTAPGAPFSLTWTGSPSAVVLAPDASVPALAAGFTPASTSGVMASSAIAVTGAMCGTSPTSLTMNGSGSPSTASVSPGLLDFGLVNCGATASAKTVTISNAAAAPSFTWTAALQSGAWYTLSATSGGPVLGGGAPAVLTVTPTTIPTTSATTPDLYGDTLTITTTAANDTPHQVDLRMTAQGAILSTSTSSVAFGSVGIGTTATQPVIVSNVGNAAATVDIASSDAAYVASPQGQVVGAGSNFTASVAFAPAAAQSYPATATLSASGAVLCGPLPPSIALSGNGTMVIAATLTPSTLDFGLVPCGSTTSGQNVMLTDTGNAGFTWSASLGTSNFTIAPPTSGSLSPGQSGTITINPAPVSSSAHTAANALGDTLTITTNPALGSPYATTLLETAKGAVLSWSPSSLAFGSVVVGSSAILPISIVNSGNVSVPVNLSVGGGKGFSVNPQATTSNAGSSSVVNVTFAPGSPAPKTDNLSLTTDGGICGTEAGSAPLSGTGIRDAGPG